MRSPALRSGRACPRTSMYIHAFVRADVWSLHRPDKMAQHPVWEWECTGRGRGALLYMLGSPWHCSKSQVRPEER